MKKKLIATLAVVAISLGAAAALLPRAAAPEVGFATLSGEHLSTSSVAEMPKMAATYRKFAPRG